jgi:hypothetical protein
MIENGLPGPLQHDDLLVKIIFYLLYKTIGSRLLSK